MLQHQHTTNSGSHWRRALAAAIKEPEALLKILELPLATILGAQKAHLDFPLRVPLSYVKRIRKADPNDPLLRQILPLDDENRHLPGFTTDPVGDQAAVIGQGLLHKYQGRVLVMTTAACPIHCRYCFRRHFPYAEHSQRRSQWQQLLEQINSDTSLSEVILSGGDPLSLDDEQLSQLIEGIDAIHHIQRIRIHSRFPVVLPERIDMNLLKWLAGRRCKMVMVIHCNHPNEINDEVITALSTMQKHGVTLLNQSVLLKGVNDKSETLIQLSEKLFEAGVMPYYLHTLDKVQGAAHFEVDEELARQLLKELRQKLPGYLVPKLVREIPGESFKQPLADN